MKRALRLFSIGLTCFAVADCGGSGTSDRQQIVNLFNGMFAAIGHGDYARTCDYLSHRQQNTVVAGARRSGLTVSSCRGALTALFKQAGVTRAQLAQAFGVSGTKRKVDSIKIHGNRATVTFAVKTRGQSYVETDLLVREGGTWRADRILKRTQTG
jgi:hypothetical protein